MGRVISPARGTEELKRLRHKAHYNSDMWDSDSVERAHSLKPGSCESCIEAGAAQRWPTCDAAIAHTCPSNPQSLRTKYIRGSFCPECSDALSGGLLCVCETPIADRSANTAILVPSAVLPDSATVVLRRKTSVQTTTKKKIAYPRRSLSRDAGTATGPFVTVAYYLIPNGVGAAHTSFARAARKTAWGLVITVYGLYVRFATQEAREQFFAPRDFVSKQ
ncbi:hypothetical protein BU15DRAFT_69356 [Melanogaster broomeanus]|nr:hypothetical protein BU15DRAFT_69356 [Melanogaster broomeanus]